MKVEAPVPVWVPPLLRVLSEEQIESERILRLHIASPRGAPDIVLLGEGGQNFSVIEVNGRENKASLPSSRFRLKTIPEEGVELVLRTASPGPLTLKLIETSYALPSEPPFQLPPRPPNVMPEPNTLSHWRTLQGERCHVLKTYTF